MNLIELSKDLFDEIHLFLAPGIMTYTNGRIENGQSFTQISD